MDLKNIKTYQEAINDFLNRIKQLPVEQRDNILKNILIELNSSNLEVAKKILTYFQKGLIETNVRPFINQQYLDNLMMEISKIDITDYEHFNQAVIELKANQNIQVLEYVKNQEYNNYCILEKWALENNSQNDLAELNEQLLTKANSSNLFKERLDVKKWLEFLDQNNILTESKSSRTMAA